MVGRSLVYLDGLTHCVMTETDTFITEIVLSMTRQVVADVAVWSIAEEAVVAEGDSRARLEGVITRVVAS